MEGAIDDEITSINSIYGDETLILVSRNPTVCTLRLFSHPHVILRLEFPNNYPDDPPSLLGTETVGVDTPKGEGKKIVDISRNVLALIFRPGEACIFDLIEDVAEQLKNVTNLQAEREEQQHEEPSNLGDGTSVPQDLIGLEPPWTTSAAFTEKKSVFVARAAAVTSTTQAKQFLQHLLATDKKVAKATHNITAWRIHRENGATYQDCDDDGEDAAGGRLLHLLQLMDVWNVTVVVSRWYGGIKLGPDRFRLINSTARDALVAGGFTNETDDAGKKKGKR